MIDCVCLRDMALRLVFLRRCAMGKYVDRARNDRRYEAIFGSVDYIDAQWRLRDTEQAKRDQVAKDKLKALGHE